MQLPALSYVLRKTKEMVGAQNVVNDHGLNLCNVKTMSGNLIGSIKPRVKKIKGALGFDDMYIKQGINWDLNQTKIVGVDPQLSYDVISNEFKKASSDIHESNTESDDETTEDNSAILDKLTLAKHHIVMKFTPFDNELKKSSFIVSSESVSKVTPGKLANMALASIKTLGFYGFQVCVVVADGATENNSFFKEG